MKQRNASSKSVSKGDLGVGGAGSYAHASFVNDVNAFGRKSLRLELHDDTLR